MFVCTLPAHEPDLNIQLILENYFPDQGLIASCGDLLWHSLGSGIGAGTKCCLTAHQPEYQTFTPVICFARNYL